MLNSPTKMLAYFANSAGYSVERTTDSVLISPHFKVSLLDAVEITANLHNYFKTHSSKLLVGKMMNFFERRKESKLTFSFFFLLFIN